MHPKGGTGWRVSAKEGGALILVNHKGTAKTLSEVVRPQV